MHMKRKSAKIKLPDKFNLWGGEGQDFKTNFDMSFVCLNLLQRVNINLLSFSEHLLDNVCHEDVRVFASNGPRREKTCLRGSANNTGADQPAHPHSLISAFVIRVFESS